MIKSGTPRTAWMILLVLILGAHADDVLAYIGPGAGLSLIGSLFGWIVGLFLTLFAIVLWPLRYLVRRLFRRGRRPDATAAPTEPAAVPTPPLD